MPNCHDCLEMKIVRKPSSKAKVWCKKGIWSNANGTEKTFKRLPSRNSVNLLPYQTCPKFNSMDEDDEM